MFARRFQHLLRERSAGSASLPPPWDKKAVALKMPSLIDLTVRICATAFQWLVT
jgi:hypothetical protein